MATFGGFNFTTLSGINLKNTAAVRFEADGTTSSTLSVRPSLDAARAWYLPDKTGTLPITGTFAVQVPAVSGFSETAVTVSGIRREDALVCQIRDMGNTVTTGRGFPIILGARPENGYIYLTFGSTGTATLYSELVVSYTAAR